MSMMITNIPDPPPISPSTQMVTTTQPPQNFRPHPFWWPDTRGWLTIGFFFLSAFILYATVYEHEAVKENQLFAQIATAVVIGGLIGVVLSYYMGSSKQSQENSVTASTLTQTLAERVVPAIPPAPTPTPTPAVNPVIPPNPTPDGTADDPVHVSTDNTPEDQRDPNDNT